MKLERLSQNKIKYSISFEELSDKGFLEDEFESFIWHDLFDEMVEVAKSEYHFEVPDTISIEIFSLSSSEIVLILTIDESTNDDEYTKGHREKSKKTDVVYRFESIEDVISLSMYLNNLHLNILARLYTFEDIYYLVTNNQNHFLIEEFGTFSEISLYLLEEYGNIIIENNALDVLYTYFNRK